jgi:hypothetical protein
VSWSGNAKLAQSERVTSRNLKQRNKGGQTFLQGEKFNPILFNVQYLSLPPFEAMTRWFIVVMGYSRRALTNNKDKLPAISGLASLVQKATGYKYLAGLWEEEIRRSLIWQRSGRDDDLGILAVPQSKLQALSSPYRAPTWSWASIDKPIPFLDGAHRLDVSVVKTRRGVDPKPYLNPELQVLWPNHRRQH